MKMLIGISTPTSGEAVVAGYERYWNGEEKYRYEPKILHVWWLDRKENITFLEFTV
jgi:ABC-type multidrug transport system ATPase subunit